MFETRPDLVWSGLAWPGRSIIDKCHTILCGRWKRNSSRRPRHAPRSGSRAAVAVTSGHRHPPATATPPNRLRGNNGGSVPRPRPRPRPYRKGCAPPAPAPAPAGQARMPRPDPSCRPVVCRRLEMSSFCVSVCVRSYPSCESSSFFAHACIGAAPFATHDAVFCCCQQRPSERASLRQLSPSPGRWDDEFAAWDGGSRGLPSHAATHHGTIPLIIRPSRAAGRFVGTVLYL